MISKFKELKNKLIEQGLIISGELTDKALTTFNQLV